jgi:hypothetical protein
VPFEQEYKNGVRRTDTRIQGAERFHLAFDEHGKVMDVARSGQRKTGAVRVRE